MAPSNLTVLSDHVQRRFFHALGAMAPGLAAEVALAKFLTPPRPGSGFRGFGPADGKSALIPLLAATAGTPIDVRFRGAKLSIRRWGTGPRVLLVHGWGSSREHFRHVIPALVDQGLSVVAFDAPAHGASSGRRLDAMVFASAIRAIWKECGGFHGAVGHSFGAACLLLAVGIFELPVQRLVSIAAPSSILWLTEDFARREGLSANTTRRMQDLLEARTGLPWPKANLETTLASLEALTLLVHDELDPVVPYEHCERLALRARHAVRLTTRGRGHTGPLTDSGVITRLRDFLNPERCVRASSLGDDGAHG